MICDKMKMGWVGHVACTGEIRNACKILAGKPERKRPLGRSRHRWEDNLNTYFKNRVGMLT
jgi:hypothetical protein